MFEPWVGTRYREADNTVGRRLLILGESHYGDREHPEQVGTCDPGMTKWVVENMALAGSNRFFTNLTQLVAGKARSAMGPNEIRNIWESVVFYNYVPVIVATTPGVPPTPEMFEKGREPFLHILEEHKPDAILVCGYRLWWHLLTGLPDHLKDNAEYQPFRRIGGAVAARMKHPGWAFNSLKQHDTVLKELLRRARSGTADSAL